MDSNQLQASRKNHNKRKKNSSATCSCSTVSTSCNCKNTRSCYNKKDRMVQQDSCYRTTTNCTVSTTATTNEGTVSAATAFAVSSSHIVDQILALVQQEDIIYHGQIIDYYNTTTTTTTCLEERYYDPIITANTIQHDPTTASDEHTDTTINVGCTVTKSSTGTIHPNISIVSNNNSRHCDEDDVFNEMDLSCNSSISCSSSIRICSRDSCSNTTTIKPSHHSSRSIQRCNSTNTTGSSINDVAKVETLQSPRTVYQHHDPHQQRKVKQQQQQYKYWRTQMYEWCCMVIDAYNLDYEIVSMSFNILDRYVTNELYNNSTTTKDCVVQNLLPITREDYQLFSMTCLYIAIKLLHGTTPSLSSSSSFYCCTKISLQTFVDMSKNYYTTEVIETTECDILQSLDWYLHAPTPISYVRLLLQLLPKSIQLIIEPTLFSLLKIATVQSYFCTKKSIDIALCVLYQTIQIHHQNKELSDVYVTQILHTRDVQLHDLLIQKNDCPEFRRVYKQLMKYY